MDLTFPWERVVIMNRLPAAIRFCCVHSPAGTRAWQVPDERLFSTMFFHKHRNRFLTIFFPDAIIINAVWV